METLPSVLLVIALLAVSFWLKYQQAKESFSRDLGNAGVQTLFPKDDSNQPTTR